MNIFKRSKEKIALAAIVVLSALLSLANLGIEGYSNQYYAAGVKSMTLSLKNFFFVAMDPAGFVSIDKPPLGFWMQTISAKIFGFSGWSIILPQALAGVLSVVLIYYLVKKSFGSAAGLIAALCLAVTPVFVAASRNNTIDNQLVFVLLLACWAISIAAEKGKFKYLILSMVFVGIGFNVKMLQAYMILPAIYVLYLFSSSISVKKRMMHLIAGTAVLLIVSLSWAWIVDAVPAADRPYVGSSNNNTVTGLIIGHNGTERLGGLFSIFTGGNSKSGGGPGSGGGGFIGGGGPPSRMNKGTWENSSASNVNSRPVTTADNTRMPQLASNNGNYYAPANNQTGNGMSGNPIDGNWRNPGPGGSNNQQFSGRGQGGGPGDGAWGGGPGGGAGSGLSGTFGNQTPAGITRLFARNILSDQIVWFIPLAVLGFLAAAIRVRLKFRLDNKKKQALVMWFMWFLPEFIYFSYNTGLFHNYYLTMMAPPIAALAGIGIVSMWKMYKEGGWKSWFLPLALLANGAVQLLMQSYFYSTSGIVKILTGLLIILCFASSLVLMVVNILPGKDTVSAHENAEVRPDKLLKLKKTLTVLAVAGLLITPATGSAAAMFYAVNSSFPAAGLELLPVRQSAEQQPNVNQRNNGGDNQGQGVQNNGTTDLITFLNNHQVNGMSQVVVSSSNTAERLTINSNVYVGSLSGFMGNETVMSLDKFKQLVKDGEVRYVLAGGNDGRGGSSNSEIMTWVKANGKLVSYAAAGNTTSAVNQSPEQLYDLIACTTESNR